MGNVYVSDSGNDRVQKFASDGTFVTKWGSSGSGDGQFNGVAGIAVDGSGNVYVADSAGFGGNERIQKFTSSGSFITKWGSPGSATGQFEEIQSIAVDGNGYVYTTERLLDRVQMFTSDGTFTATWGEFGTTNGKFFEPLGIAAASSGTVYVADTRNHRIQKFVPDTTPPTADTISPSTTGPTNVNSVSFTVTFSEDVVNFNDASDVIISHSGTAHTGVGISGGPATYTVSVTGISGTGSFTMAVDTSSDIQDLSGNALDSSVTSASVSIDNTPPTLSIGSPSASDTNSGPVTYTVTYSGADSVTFADGNVTLNKTGTADGTVAVSGSGTTSRTITVSSISGDGTLGISIGTASDAAGNSAGPAGPSTTFTVDNTAPGISVGSPSVSATSGGPVSFVVSYTGADAISLDNGDVTLVSTGDANGTIAVTGSGTSSRTVTVSGITGDGTVGISLASGTATDGAGNGAPGAGPSATFTVDNTAPTVSIGAPSVSDTQSGPVIFAVSYSGASAVSLGDGDVTLNKTGTADGSVAVTGSGTSSRTITISGISGDGTLGISLASDSATDDVGNGVAATGPSATFNVDNTAPVVTVTPLTTSDSRPALAGTIDDAGAVISVTVDGQVNSATNNGTTWVLPDNTLTTLAAGTYDVQVTAADSVGNIGADSTSDELVIQSSGSGGGQITSNLLPEETMVGSRLELTAPGGFSDYRWKKDGLFLVDGGNVSGVDTSTLVMDPLEMVDSGVYSVQYEDGIARAVVETDGYVVAVLAEPAALPLSGGVAAIIVVAIVVLAMRTTKPTGLGA